MSRRDRTPDTQIGRTAGGAVKPPGPDRDTVSSETPLSGPPGRVVTYPARPDGGLDDSSVEKLARAVRDMRDLLRAQYRTVRRVHEAERARVLAVTAKETARAEFWATLRDQIRDNQYASMSVLVAAVTVFAVCSLLVLTFAVAVGGVDGEAIVDSAVRAYTGCPETPPPTDQ